MFLISAFCLGLLVAFNPCQIAINISALTYLNGRCKSPADMMRKGVLYAVGKAVTYTLLGEALIYIWERTVAVQAIKTLLSKGEDVLPYIMLIIGVFLFVRAFHSHNHHGDDCHNSGKTIQRSGPSGALFLGLMLAFAFCPESAIIFFGMLMPLAVTKTFGMLAPIAFAVAAVVPVVVLTYLMVKASSQMKLLALRFKHFQKWTNVIIGSAFIIAAVVLYMM